MASRAPRISAAEIIRAKLAAEEAGLRLAGIERRPDGSIKLEFGESSDGDNADWWAGSPLYRGKAA